MKYFTWLFSLAFLSGHAAAQQTQHLKHLGDALPADTPILLKLQVSKGHFAAERIALSPDGAELYFGERNGYDADSTANILKMRYADEAWGEPEIVFKDNSGAPALSPDGQTLYFQYDHPTRPTGLCLKKADAGWGPPQPFSQSIDHSHYLQSTQSGTRYFYGSDDESRKQGIFASADAAPIGTSLDLGPINEIEWDFYIARDESYVIIMMARKQNRERYRFHGSRDFFISFKDESGEWTNPVNLGAKINGPPHDYKWGPYVSDDNKYFFFTSGTGVLNRGSTGVYWVDFETALAQSRATALNQGSP